MKRDRTCIGDTRDIQVAPNILTLLGAAKDTFSQRLLRTNKSISQYTVRIYIWHVSMVHMEEGDIMAEQMRV